MAGLKRDRSPALTRDGAEALALTCLGFLAEDPRRLGRFLSLTGIDPDTLREEAGTAGVQQAALDYLLTDESLLLMFAANSQVAPETIAVARGLLDQPAGGGGRT